jgi:hypothetical protein
MIQRVEALDPDRKAALALSGGIDSTTVLFAMLASGRKPRCYTFYCEGHESDDLRSSRQLAKDFALELIEVPVPVDHESIMASSRQLIHLHAASKVKKTIIQCMHPWLYICPQMQARGDKHILIGFAADNYYCITRRDSKRLRLLGEVEFKRRGYRDHMFTNLEYVDGNVALLCRRSYDIVMDDVYASGKIQEWFKLFTVETLHRAEDGSRLQKSPSLYAFEDYYGRGHYYRDPSSYQVNSNLREFHEGLLWNEKYNPGRKFKNVIGVYNAIAKGML